VQHVDFDVELDIDFDLHFDVDVNIFPDSNTHSNDYRRRLQR
jgi:hypothetical protein